MNYPRNFNIELKTKFNRVVTDGERNILRATLPHGIMYSNNQVKEEIRQSPLDRRLFRGI